MSALIGIGGQQFESEDENSPLDYSIVDKPCHPALQTDVILRQVFGFLKYEDIKACRQVSSKWRKISQPIFGKKSRILLVVKRDAGDPKTPEILAEHSEELMENFQSILSSMPAFSVAVGLKCTSAVPLSVYGHVLNSDAGSHINDLKLSQMYLTDQNGKWINSYEIQKLIGERNICLTSLYVSSGQFSISPKSIPMIENLSLLECTIIIDGEKISPKKLVLAGVKFLLGNKEKSSNTCINDFLNFDRINSIELEGCTTIADENISIDMSEPGVTVDSLSVNDMKIDWKSAKWEIRKVTLYDVSFLHSTEAKIKELHVKSMDDEEVDLSILPKSIELLNLYEKPVWSSKIVLPNLKHLILWDSKCLTVVPYLDECKNFELLEIVNGPSNKNGFNNSITPIYGTKTVKKCRIHDVIGSNKGTINFQFQTIVVDCQILPRGEHSYICKITQEFIVLSGSFVIRAISDDDDTEYLMNYINSNSKYQTIALGSIKWEGSVSPNHPLLSIVDKKAEHYLFENKNPKKPGMTINKFQFEKLSVFEFGKRELYFMN